MYHPQFSHIHPHTHSLTYTPLFWPITKGTYNSIYRGKFPFLPTVSHDYKYYVWQVSNNNNVAGVNYMGGSACVVTVAPHNPRENVVQISNAVFCCFYAGDTCSHMLCYSTYVHSIPFTYFCTHMHVHVLYTHTLMLCRIDKMLQKIHIPSGEVVDSVSMDVQNYSNYSVCCFYFSTRSFFQAFPLFSTPHLFQAASQEHDISQVWHQNWSVFDVKFRSRSSRCISDHSILTAKLEKYWFPIRVRNRSEFGGGLTGFT